MMRAGALGLLLLAGCAGQGAGPPIAPAARAGAEAEIGRVLDALHVAASKADGPAYFGLYTPDAVFIGTDVGERWSLPAFRAYAEPHFSQGKGWTYRPRSRSVVLVPDGRTAWFDEVLDSESYGTSRGSGVLVRDDRGRWRVAQYVLSFPIPNDLAKEMTARIKAYEAARPPS